MPAVKGRSHGRSHRITQRGTPTVLLQGRVSEEARDAARDAADAAGISIAAYLEALVLADAEHHLVRPDADTHPEALPA
jgi:predicted alpha/beta-hydrolase family hydrolase